MHRRKKRLRGPCRVDAIAARRRAASMHAGRMRPITAISLQRSVAMLDRMNAERGQTVSALATPHDLATEVIRQRMRKIIYRVSFVPQIG